MLAFIVYTQGSLNTEINEIAEVANSIRVTHCDCEGFGFNETDIYNVGEVPNCKMAPEDIELAATTITLYQKSYLREVEAIRCHIKHN